MYADRSLRPWLDAARAQVPGLEIADGHLHVGLTDPAGYEATGEELVAALELAGARGAVFPVSDPEGYAQANEDVVRLARAHPDRLVAFARLRPDQEPVAEAVRRLAEGARGLKLHPRGDDFAIADRRLDELFDLAAERRLPIVVHDGAGSEETGVQCRDRVEQHPGVRIVLAHCAIGCFPRIVPAIAEVPDLLVDTSWWNVSDLWAAMRRIPPSQVVHASDVPFNSPTQAALMTLRVALQAGLGPDDVRAVMGGNLQRLLDGEDIAPRPAPTAEAPPLEPELERLYVTLCSAVVPMLGGDPPGQAMELARSTCRRPHGPRPEVVDAVRGLLDLAERYTEPDPLRPHRTPGWDIVLTAALVARTPDVALVP